MKPLSSKIKQKVISSVTGKILDYLKWKYKYRILTPAPTPVYQIKLAMGLYDGDTSNWE